MNISLKFVPSGLVTNIPTLVQLMACSRPGDKPFSETMMVRLQSDAAAIHSANGTTFLMDAALPLVNSIATATCCSSNTGPWIVQAWQDMHPYISINQRVLTNCFIVKLFVKAMCKFGENKFVTHRKHRLPYAKQIMQYKHGDVKLLIISNMKQPSLILKRRTYELKIQMWKWKSIHFTKFIFFVLLSSWNRKDELLLII